MTKIEDKTDNQVAMPNFGLQVVDGGKGLLTQTASCQTLEDTFRQLVTWQDASGWFLGDLLLEISERLASKDTPSCDKDRYRAMESQIKRLSKRGKRFSEARVVCQRIPPEKRRDTLLFELHAAVLVELQNYGRSTDGEIDHWLTQAEDRGYKLSELRLAMRQAFQTPGTQQTKPFASVNSVMRPFRQLVKEIRVSELTPEQADQIRADLSGIEDFLRELSAVK